MSLMVRFLFWGILLLFLRVEHVLDFNLKINTAEEVILPPKS